MSLCPGEETFCGVLGDTQTGSIGAGKKFATSMIDGLVVAVIGLVQPLVLRPSICKDRASPLNSRCKEELHRAGGLVWDHLL